MAQAYLYFPRGYRLPLVTAVDTESDGDEEVIAIYKEWCNTQTKTDWKFVDRVMRCAHRLIPDVDVFTVYQRNNHRLVDHSYNYLYEIVQFITTGKHQLSPMSAIELMDDDPEQAAAMKFNEHPEVPRVRSVIPDRQRSYLTYWLGQPNGIEDIVCTLYVLFGGRRSPNKTK